MPAMYPAISVRQPWAWLIANGFKDVENRSWKTRFRGSLLIHASASMTVCEYDDAKRFVEHRTKNAHPAVCIPPKKDLELGGIVGCVELVDCDRNSKSPWYMGDIAYHLANAQTLSYFKCKGRLGIFHLEVPHEVAAAFPVGLQPRMIVAPIKASERAAEVQPALF